MAFSRKKIWIAFFAAALVLFYWGTAERTEAATTNKGWVLKDNSWYYYDHGKPATGWVLDSGKWYYLDPSGKMKTGWVLVNQKWYFLNQSGAMATGWLKQQTSWYYLDSSGAMRTGWLQVSGHWYYFEKSGQMKTGWLLDNGNWYYLNTAGVMRKGWLDYHGDTYYFHPDGRMATGWIKDSYFKYYLESSGVMAKGWKLISGEWYYFQYYNGVMLSQTFVDGYYLHSDGTWAQPGKSEVLPNVNRLKEMLDVGITQDGLIEAMGPDYRVMPGIHNEYWFYALKVTDENQYVPVKWDSDEYSLDDIADGIADIFVIFYWNADKTAYYVGIEYFDTQHRFHSYYSTKQDIIY
ncbi:MAG: hypothetical protein AB2392_22860 [Neobacillus sp.]